MYCPRCGTPNEEGDRFCSSCGAALKTTAVLAEKRSRRERLAGLLGTTRKARLVTGATAIALVVAIVGFIALKPAKDTIPRDAYTIEADHICLSAKQQIVAAEQGPQNGIASALVPIVGSWRSQFKELAVPADRVAQAQELEAALLEAQIQIAALARFTAAGNEKQTVASAKRADVASTGVEEAVASLGLSECAAATIGLSQKSS